MTSEFAPTTPATQIIAVAVDLFQHRGFDRVSLADVAQASATPQDQLGYASTIWIALAFYQQLAQETRASIAELPQEKLASNYQQVLKAKIDQITPHSDTISALFAAAMRPHSGITTADISPGLQDPMVQTFVALVQHASDTPTNPDDAQNLALMLYTFYILTLLFWMYDRTEGRKATAIFIDFLGDFFRLIRPMMMMPMVNQAMTKMAKIMMLAFGGARLAD